MMLMKKLFGVFAVLVMIALIGFFSRSFLKELPMKLGKHPETLVYVCSSDDVISCGIYFVPPKEEMKHIAILWIHGWGTNFYDPAYVMIGRAISDFGYASLSANTRMHDLANTMKYTSNGRRIRGGGYWGKASEQTLDISAWMDFLYSEGFDKVIIVGHSAGWSAVREYQYKIMDKRVVGLVAASGDVYPLQSNLSSEDNDMLLQANTLIKEGLGDQLIEIKGRNFPSYISADAFSDNHQTVTEEERDFFGFETDHAALLKVNLPCLVIFGSRGDVADESALELIRKSAIKLNKKIDTKMIKGGDHMYKGKASEVARVISEWIEQL